MTEFLKEFVLWLHNQNLLPTEKTPADNYGMYRTYLFDIPEEATDACGISQSKQMQQPLVTRDACLKYITFTFKGTSKAKVLHNANTLYEGLLHRPDFIEDYNDSWIIINCKNGVHDAGVDTQGFCRATLDVLVTTKS